MKDPFWFWKTNIYNKIIFTTIAIVGYFTLDTYFKIELTEKTKLLKQEMLYVCSTDEHCRNVVNVYFEECFNKNFDNNEVGLYQGFDEEKFSECMNKNAEAVYFEPIRLSEL